jgi:uncharacterized protein (DUF885 family)
MTRPGAGGVARWWRPILPAAVVTCGLVALATCSRQETHPVWPALRERYFIGFLKRNPVTSTYLGGEGYSPELAGADGLLPDVTPAGRAEATAFYRAIASDLERIDPASLSPDDAIDREVVRAQIRFLLHLADDLRYEQRSLDTYTVAPFRGIDWQIQQMTDLGGGRIGTRDEWEKVVRRLAQVPSFLKAAGANLREGIAAGNVPDRRMVQHDGIEASRDNAAYFRTLSENAARRLEGLAYRDAIVAALAKEGAAAAAAFEAFGAFLEQAYGPGGGADHFACGEAEYEWRLKNNLILEDSRTAASLFQEGQREVERTQGLLIEAARGVAGRRRLGLDWTTREASLRSARRVMDDLSRDDPKSDDEMFRIYRAKAQELVTYARKHGMFALPEDYRLEIVPTPPVLESTIDAAYYPAPPFKTSGIGRFYLTASHGDVGVLKENNVHAVADLCAHEGFPGHDWHYRFMRTRARSIGNVRWLTPGEVEGSASMWADSMAAEGWALYAEQLMAEPQPGAPGGFYTPEERIYQLKGQLLRDARVHIDTGLHTGRLSFDQAVAYLTANVDLLPDACASPPGDPVREAACAAARRAIYRYSKWPTQAITYHLGKAEILDLRETMRRIQGERFSLRGFHERFLSAGTIPAGFFREWILSEARQR